MYLDCLKIVQEVYSFGLRRLPFSQDIYLFWQDLGEAELLAVVHSTGFPTAIGAVSVINHFFGRDDILLGAFKGEFGKEVIYHGWQNMSQSCIPPQYHQTSFPVLLYWTH